MALVLLRLGVSNFYVWGLVFVRLEVRDSFVWGFVFLRMGVSKSHVWRLVYLRLRVFFAKYRGKGLLSFGVGFLHLVVTFLTFEG